MPFGALLRDVMFCMLAAEFLVNDAHANDHPLLT